MASYKIARVIRKKRDPGFWTLKRKFIAFGIGLGAAGTFFLFGTVIVVISMIMNMFSAVFAGQQADSSGANFGEAYNLSDYTLAYKDELYSACGSLGFADYYQVLLAIMEIESGGISPESWPDRMCCSESPFNERYSFGVGTIQDPLYSIQVGVESLKYLVDKLSPDAINDYNELKAVVQCYNYGEGFYYFLHNNYGGIYSKEAAQAYSYRMGHGGTYGNPSYIDRFEEHFRKSAGGGFGGFSGSTDLAWPVSERYECTSGMGHRNMPYGAEEHGGIDLGTPIGTPVYACGDGVVTVTGSVSSNLWGSGATGNATYGIFVMVDHGNNVATLVAHLSERLVNVGDHVVKGQLIGYTGNSGNSSGPHLHFEYRANGARYSPFDYIDSP